MKHQEQKWVCLDQMIAKGGQAEVLRVDHRGTDEPHVFKRFYNQKTLQVETEILQQLGRKHWHRHIVKPKEFNCDGILFVFYSGGDLHDYVVNQGKLSERESSRILRKLSSALDFLHREGIAHLDVKLENVLFDSNREPYLCDFGLSVRLGADGRCNSPAGTVIFCAPELQFGAFDGRAADVWSLGVCAYAMSTGMMPAEFRNIYDKRSRHGSLLISPKQREFFSTLYLNILDACLQFQPHMRPSARWVTIMWSQLGRYDPNPSLARPDVPEDFVCPITYDVMVDPVVASDGYTYERCAIEEWFRTDVSSPKTCTDLESTILFPNHLVRRQILEWRGDTA